MARKKKTKLTWGTGNPEKNDDAAKNAAFRRWIERLVKIKALVDSPIEKSLAHAIASIWEETIGGPLHTYRGAEPDEYLPGLSLVFQCPIGNYRIDFLMTTRDLEGNIGSLAVECDGHDFHERTKEQAAHDRSRDRAILLAGLRVIRFTGSEIHRDLFQCAEEALVHVGTIQYPGGVPDDQSI